MDTDEMIPTFVLMKIFLIGYMGVGKTTIGKRLARRLKLPFRDLDAVITVEEDQTVQEIFERQGEATFRGLERKYLHELVNEEESFVLATGGGTPCFYDNQLFMNANGLTIYLEMDILSITHRLIHSKDNRPLVAGKTDEELKQFVINHLESRKEYYNDCELIFPALGFNSHKLERLVELIGSRNKDQTR